MSKQQIRRVSKTIRRLDSETRRDDSSTVSAESIAHASQSVHLSVRPSVCLSVRSACLYSCDFCLILIFDELRNLRTHCTFLAWELANICKSLSQRSEIYVQTRLAKIDAMMHEVLQLQRTLCGTGKIKY